MNALPKHVTNVNNVTDLILLCFSSDLQLNMETQQKDMMERMTALLPLEKQTVGIFPDFITSLFPTNSLSYIRQDSAWQLLTQVARDGDLSLG